MMNNNDSNIGLEIEPSNPSSEMPSFPHLSNKRYKQAKYSNAKLYVPSPGFFETESYHTVQVDLVLAM